MIIQNTIEDKLTRYFSPIHLEVLNESNMHNVPEGSESHFKVTIVADEFERKRLIQRHRAVNAVLQDELAGKVHALALHTYTQSEWQSLNELAPDSPACAGGGVSRT
jgi:BolA protein